MSGPLDSSIWYPFHTQSKMASRMFPVSSWPPRFGFNQAMTSCLHHTSCTFSTIASVIRSMKLKRDKGGRRGMDISNILPLSQQVKKGRQLDHSH